MQPGPESYLRLHDRYLGGPLDEVVEQRLITAGGTRVAARNPYWDHWGVTIKDPDGYRLVLSHRTWS